MSVTLGSIGLRELGQPWGRNSSGISSVKMEFEIFIELLCNSNKGIGPRFRQNSIFVLSSLAGKSPQSNGFSLLHHSIHQLT